MYTNISGRGGECWKRFLFDCEQSMANDSDGDDHNMANAKNIWV